MRPRVFDAFPWAGTPTELLLLECRLTELYDTVDAFIVVEARVDHQDHPKPLHYLDHQDEFAAWKDKIVYVVAEALPTAAENSWQWAREHAQREWIFAGLEELGAEPDDIIMQSDADEIPTALVARNVRPQRNQLIAFHQRGHFWAIDWQYPDPPGWNGTVATRVETLAKLARPSCGPFTAMRDMRNSSPQIPNAGWHASWLGGLDSAMTKVGSFCHPEVEERIVKGAERFYREGIHVDGQKMLPVDVDKTWPRWMQDPANVPASWLRPR